jgi:hypothetical protein
MKRALLPVPALLVSLVGGLVTLALAPSAPLTVPDSILYLRFVPTVPLLYPAFATSLPGYSLIAAQVVLFTLSVAFLSAVIARQYERPVIAALMAMALFVNPQLAMMLWTLMSEGLFIPLFTLSIGAGLLYVASGRKAALVCCAATAGLCVAVRPAALPIIPIFALFPLLRWETGSWRRRALLFVLSLAVSTGIVVAERAVWRHYHGDQATTLMASHLFAKASLVAPASPNLQHAEPAAAIIADAMENRYRPVRDLLGAQRGTLAYPPLLAFYEVCVQHICSHQLRQQIGLPAPRTNEIMTELALERIAGDPAGYLSLALDEYRSMWVIGVRSHPTLGPAYDRQIAGLRPLPFKGLVAPELYAPSSPSRLTYVVRPAFILMGAATVLICLVFGYLALFGRADSKLTLPVLIPALSVQGICAFIALAGIGDGRYTMGLWTGIACSLVMALSSVLIASKRVWSRRAPSTNGTLYGQTHTH